MKTFGSSNSQQSSSQTGDDNLEVEVQTEEITTVNKWTQNPPRFGPKLDLEDVRAVRTNLLGVGGDRALVSGDSHNLRLAPSSGRGGAVIRADQHWSQVVKIYLRSRAGLAGGPGGGVRQEGGRPGRGAPPKGH